MELPNVSVVIPIRNEEKYISRCLASILSQDYPMDKLEILAVDGMSEDGTREILNEYAKKHNNIRVIDNPNRIVPKALNIGIKNAKGEIIARIDSHSTYASDYIAKCVAYLNKTDADNIGGVVEHMGNGFVGHAIALSQECIFGLGGAKFRTAKKEQYVDTVFPGVWRRKTFEKYGYFNSLRNGSSFSYNGFIS